MRVAADKIHELAARLGRSVNLMEVCGTHTMAAFRAGLRTLLPPTVRLISGPGCPVCVTEAGYIDAALELARQPGIIVATFGDLMRVPGSVSSLERERAVGADVRVVYSPLDALLLAQQNPSKRLVFCGVGFETTAPTVGATIQRAARAGTRNFSVLCAHKTIPRAMDALVRAGEIRIDGFLCPGHVSVIIGAATYRFLAEQHGVPCVISGFEPEDMLQSVVMLLAQLVEGRPTVQIQYTRSVNEHGNRAAQALLHEVFEECDANWRGLGTITGSGLAIRAKYAAYDTERVFGIQVRHTEAHPGCRCGEVLRGVLFPPECPLFGQVCTPANPVGPCMVSAEGACAAYYHFGGQTPWKR